MTDLTELVLTHFTAEPFTFDPARIYDQGTVKRSYGKPVGLWLSDESEDDGWFSWCTGEGWNLGNLAHATEFALAPEANVLRIHTETELISFQSEYGHPDPAFEHTLIPERDRLRVIDWHRVTSEHDGILITPYLYGARFDTLWYYGWDCASGCFWNLNAVVPVSDREEVPLIPGGYTHTSRAVEDG